jgi:hypothetical protein
MERRPMVEFMEMQLVPFVENHLVVIAIVCGIVGMVMYNFTERRYNNKQHAQRMFNEVNSKRYDEENIQ